MQHTLHKTILVLEDGSTYNGWSFTNSMLAFGEVVFNTGMTGYQEIITDPSYAGQMITFTYPELGNTGINSEDNESHKIYIKGIIAKSICYTPNNWRHTVSFTQYIKNNHIPHIFGIDTRALTKHLREDGVMNGCISSKTFNKKTLLEMMNTAKKIEGANLIDQVTTDKEYKLSTLKHVNLTYSHINTKINYTYNIPLNIVVIDFGVKQNILSRLLSYGCSLHVLPANSTYEEIMSHQPDGILLSNGPGDPSIMQNAIHNTKKLVHFSNLPIFGICMGHQILSLAMGGQTFKLKFGHRGLNHPTGINQKAEITSQNHGFAVKSDSLQQDNLRVTQFNLNDSTIAGIIHKKKPIFSVQYHPEASPGPHDSDYIFNHFVALIKYIKNKDSQY